MTFEVSLRKPVEPAAVPAADEADASASVDDGTVFPQSVGSGGPTPTGVVLWTRIAPAAYRATRPVAVTVAEDDAFESVVTRSRIPADEFGPEQDFTLRVDLDGELEPGSEYYYRFRYDGVVSRTGRCRTLPAPDASPDSVRLAVVVCQHYQNGYYGAFSHVAEEDVDFVLHLGDYVYDSADDRYREPNPPTYDGRDVTLPSGNGVATTLDDFRELYRTYRSDEFLQAAHERHTFIRCWDDHAVTNNRYWDYEADAPVAPDHPRGDDPAFVRQLTADGIQAWWEYTPARADYDPDADHLHDAFRLWHRLDFGDLVTLLLTDERLFRSPPPNAGDASRLLPARPFDDPSATMLGDDQREWFLDAVRADDARWTAWANEVLSMPFRFGVGPASFPPNPDAWDGYTHERDRVFGALSTAENAVTLTGDMHTTIAGYQELPDGSRAGVEFMTPSVTSVNIAEAVGVESGLLGRLTQPVLSWVARAMNRQFTYFDSHHWGYSVAEFTPDALTVTTYSVDKATNAADADREPMVRFRVPAGSTEMYRRPV
ncbi:alkaline phosphatase D family protein [Halobacteriaceae archaeon GCM10025711]